MGRTPLHDHMSARRALSRLLREFKAAKTEDRDTPAFRALVHAFSVLLQYFAFAKDLEVESRIEKIEQRLDELK